MSEERLAGSQVSVQKHQCDEGEVQRWGMMEDVIEKFQKSEIQEEQAKYMGANIYDPALNLITSNL